MFAHYDPDRWEGQCARKWLGSPALCLVTAAADEQGLYGSVEGAFVPSKADDLSASTEAAGVLANADPAAAAQRLAALLSRPDVDEMSISQLPARARRQN